MTERRSGEDRRAQPFDVVERAKHYNLHASGVEAIELCELLPFNLGNALKYVWRAGEKDDRRQDLMKAHWYTERHHQQMIRNEYPETNLCRHVEVLAERVRIAEQGTSLLGRFLACMVADNSAGCMAEIEIELHRLRAEVDKQVDEINATIKT